MLNYLQNLIRVLFERNEQLEHELVERKQTEVAAGQLQEKLLTLHEISNHLATIESFDDLCRQAVELGRERLGFDRLGLWLYDEATNMMIGSFGTDEQGNTRDERGQRFPFTVDDYIRKAIQDKTLVTVVEDSVLYDNYKQVVGRGWDAAAILWNGDQSMGWLNADNLLSQQPFQPYQGEILSLYSITLGHLFTRKRAEEELRRRESTAREFQEKLKVLHEVSIELMMSETLDDLCRHTVELGRERLGFDRLGVWLYDEQTDSIHGMFGTDEQGHLRDERNDEFTMDDEPTRELLKLPVGVRQNVPIYGMQNEIVGYGWVATTLMWADGARTGCLFTDNLLNQEPMRSYQPELLQLYGGTVGHLITQKRAADALRRSEEHFAKIFQANPNAISISMVNTGRNLDVNPSWTRLFGYSREEAVGQSGVELNLWVDLAERNRVMEMARTQGNLRDVEVTLRSRFGTIIHALMSAEFIELNGQRYLLSMLQDITARKQAEQQHLELALANERMDAMRQFLGNISHDLKTPLTVMANALYLMERMTEPEKQQRQLEKIKTQMQLLQKFIQDILTLSRLDHIPEFNLQPLNLNVMLNDIEQNLRASAETKNLEMNLNLDFNSVDVMGDHEEVYRALVNLVENALHYTPDGGRVVISSQVKDGFAIIGITDSGIGISEADLPHIFDRFYRSSVARNRVESGSGLGLAIVKRVIDVHQGSIEVESTLGQGTTFRIRLPLAAQVAGQG
jgi:PAS domain S-box-containing protein